MSLESWKAEFYPVSADGVPAEKALAHSLQKWIGLRRENLNRHHVQLKNGHRTLYSLSEKIVLSINCDSCALCTHYLRTIIEDVECTQCPLFKVRNVSCDQPRTPNDDSSPYLDWLDQADPEPMISLIQFAISQS